MTWSTPVRRGRWERPPHELGGLTRRLTVLIEALLLQEVGLEEDRVRETVRRAGPPYRTLKFPDLIGALEDHAIDRRVHGSASVSSMMSPRAGTFRSVAVV